MATAKQKVKVWRIRNTSPAGIQLNENSVEITAGTKNSLVVSEAGIGLVGKSVTLGPGSENVRHAGLFVELPDFGSMIPSTIVTPLPNRIPSPPMGYMSLILKALPVFIAAMQGIVSKDEE